MAVNVEEYIPNATEKPRLKITSDKFKATFTVVPSIGGFVFYKIETSSGELPKELKGQYTRMEEARKAVERYELKHPGTKAVDRDRKVERRNASKLRGSGSGNVRTGSDNGEVGTDLPGECLNG